MSYTQSDFTVNKSHLDYLYEEINIDGKEMAIIHIYSNAPDYKYIGDDNEGIACVDDAARAAIFYLEYYKAYNDSLCFNKANKLIDFLLYMQDDNGFFYNFIWGDHSINKNYERSVAEPNWWSWRALWALMEDYKLLNYSKTKTAAKVRQSIEKTISVIKRGIPKKKSKEVFGGVEIPDWMPNQSASDQAALLVLSLTDYYALTGDEEILEYLRSLVNGIIIMQIKNSEYKGAFLSWQNTWHGWGNSQAYALLKAYRILKDEKIKKSALNELDNFYDQLIKDKFVSNFSIQKDNKIFKIVDCNKFPQIAYCIRPMVFALLEAYDLTNDSLYAIKAGKTAQWFNGYNLANTSMYNPKNGIIYDGIENETLVNKNSGAESTIEGLLSLLKISLNPIALKEFETSN